MPSPLATILFTWAAIYAYAGAFYCMLHLRRPRHMEYLAFGLCCFGLAVWTLGSALGQDARTLAEGEMALRFAYVGGFASVAFYCDFASRLARRGARGVVLAAYACMALSIVVDVSGLLVDGTRRAPDPFWADAAAPDRIEPALTLLGSSLTLVALGFSGWGVWVMSRGMHRERELRVFVGAGALALLAAGLDAMARSFPLPPVHLLEHAGLFPVFAISWILMQRFVRAADELGQRTDELRQSYGDLRATQEVLVRKEQLAAVGELSAVIAHEVRNPLAIIKNAVSSLRRSTLRASDRRVLLGILDEEMDRLNRLVRDLLAYARPVEPRGRAVELGVILDEALQKALSSHDDPGAIHVELDVARCPTVHGDPDLLRQAFTNVIDNGVCAMTAGGTLVVRAEPTRLDGRGAVAVEVIDRGEGMDSLVLKKARDPFFTTRASGTGLGLAIVERVIKNHGGALSIASAPGEGTTVRVVLPRQRPSSAPPPMEGA